MALLYAWLSGTSADAWLSGQEVWHALARRHLDRAVEQMCVQAWDASLYYGVPGVAWAADLVDQLLDPEGDDRNDDIDAHLALLVRHPPAWAPVHDLMGGLTGVGVYALRRFPRRRALKCLEQILEALERAGQYDAQGVYWWTHPSEAPVPGEVEASYPRGYADLGMAHGVAGIISLLGAVCRYIPQAGAESLLEPAVRWLLAQQLSTESGPTFPVWVAPGVPSTSARAAWCYGDPGIAVALLTAARGLQDAGLERHAVALARAAAGRPYEKTGALDARFCHGTAGLAHVYNRLYQATGETLLAEAARYWIKRTLDHYRRAAVLAESDFRWLEDDEVPWSGLDVVDGAAGVALVLLAAATSLEPEWDGMFLLSPGLTAPSGRPM